MKSESEREWEKRYHVEVGSFSRHFCWQDVECMTVLIRSPTIPTNTNAEAKFEKCKIILRYYLAIANGHSRDAVCFTFTAQPFLQTDESNTIKKKSQQQIDNVHSQTFK